MKRYLSNFSIGKKNIDTSDVLVIGSGVAGLMSALWLSEYHSVTLITKGVLGESSSKYAQGGVAAAISLKDSPDKHLKDTLEAGGYTNKMSATKLLVNLGPKMIDELTKRGLKFDSDRGAINLALEGGHSIPRVLHVADDTGAVIQDILSTQIRESNIRIMENLFAVDLITSENVCNGVIAKNGSTFKAFLAKRTILATGGAGHVFAKTTNPEVSTGDGIAMAYRAGCGVLDMEFVQFHPTTIKGVTGPKSLITESLRGEGAYLVDDKGSRFMKDKHPMAELAPRDVIVRCMAEKMAKGYDKFFLDARHLNDIHLYDRFPTVYKNLKELGLDLAKDLIPVEPSAHFFMGGIATDLKGRTMLKNLYSCGETTCSGVHGANRLASNSLLEGLAFSYQIFTNILTSNLESSLQPQAPISSNSANTMKVIAAMKLSGLEIQNLRNSLQDVMTNQAGLVRSKKSILNAMDKIDRISKKMNYSLSSNKEFELANISLTAKTICRSALSREESRGAHFRSDCPKKDKRWNEKHILIRSDALSVTNWQQVDKTIGKIWSK